MENEATTKTPIPARPGFRIFALCTLIFALSISLPSTLVEPPLQIHLFFAKRTQFLRQQKRRNLLRCKGLRKQTAPPHSKKTNPNEPNQTQFAQSQNDPKPLSRRALWKYFVSSTPAKQTQSNPISNDQRQVKAKSKPISNTLQACPACRTRDCHGPGGLPMTRSHSAIPKLPGCVIMAKTHQNRHDDLRFLLQIRGERRKIPIATQPVRLRLPPVARTRGGGVTDGGTRAGLLCEALRRLAKQRSPCYNARATGELGHADVVGVVFSGVFVDSF